LTPALMQAVRADLYSLATRFFTVYGFVGASNKHTKLRGTILC
jgi:hypothetical protein